MNLSDFKGIWIFAEQREGKLQKVALELIGQGKELSKKLGVELTAVLLGYDIDDIPRQLISYGADKVLYVNNPLLKNYNTDGYTKVIYDLIQERKPEILLVGATYIGRDLAPRISSRLGTGLTADCTILDIKENTDLVQIRPAFGGNIMAQIINPNNRPQLATVRYKVMDAPERSKEKIGKVTLCSIDKGQLDSQIKVLKVTKKQVEESISDADIIIAVGRGLKKEKDLDMINELAELIGAQIATTRPLIEAGWTDAKRQIGLSGRTVKPKLIITCGISGAVQFTAGMNNADCIVAINKDPKASIFNVAHYGIVGDIYEVIPTLINNIKEGKALAV